MGYYNTWSTEVTSNLCTNIISWIKYHYKHLPMVVSNSPENLKQNMNDLLQVSEFIHVYIYDILILTRINWAYHVHKLKLN